MIIIIYNKIVFDQTRMVNRTMAAIAAFALIASTAKASANMDNFITFVEGDFSVDALLMLMVDQIYNLIVPFIGAVLGVLLDYLWNNATYTLSAGDFGDITFDFSTVFGLIGVGNYEVLFESFMGIVYNGALGFIADQDLPVLTTVVAPTYTVAQSNLVDLIQLGDLIPGYVSTGTDPLGLNDE